MVVNSFKIQSFLDQMTTSRHRTQATADFSDHEELSEDDVAHFESSKLSPSSKSKMSCSPPPPQASQSLASSAPAAGAHFMSIPNHLLHVSSHSSPQSSS